LIGDFLLPTIALSTGCEVECTIAKQRSTDTLYGLRKKIEDGLILVTTREQITNILKSDSDSLHIEEFRNLIRFAHAKRRLWIDDDLPEFVVDKGHIDLTLFSNLKAVMLKKNESNLAKQWKELFSSNEFPFISNSEVMIRELQDGAEEIQTSFLHEFPKKTDVKSIYNHIRPLIIWASSITIYDGYCIENSIDSDKNKTNSGLKNLLVLISQTRHKKNPLNRIRVLARRNNGPQNLTKQALEHMKNLLEEIEIKSVINIKSDRNYGIQLLFHPKKMGERWIVFERDGAELAFNLGHSGMQHLDTNSKDETIRECKLEGPKEFKIGNEAGSNIIQKILNTENYHLL
tara:strand:+ start:2574 stop:3611 length:1038 start_codon:yes stop_codon:yes gene_type:complete